MSKGLYNPTAAVTALRKRAEAIAPGTFEAEVRLLFFLAREWMDARVAAGGENTGVVRDMAREFGLAFRATTSAVRDLENELASRVAVVDWKAEMEAAVEGG